MISGPAKYLVLTFSFLVLSFNFRIAAQEKQPNGSPLSIEQEIKSYEETDLSLLSKSRAVLIKALTNNDTLKAEVVLKYMQDKFDTSKVVILYPVEKLFVDFFLRDYQSVFTEVLKQDFDNANYENKLTPQRDLFFNEMKEISRKENLQLEEGIKLSSLTQYKTDFLYLLLKSLIVKNDSQEEKISYWDEINGLSDEYLSYYKDTEFNPFIHKYLRYVLKTSPWGFGYEFSVGYLTLPGTLGRHVDGFGLISMAFESSFQNIYSCLRLDIGMAEKVRNEFFAGGTWNEGLKISHIGALLAFGPMISLGSNYTLTPNLGIGVLNFSTPDQEHNTYGQEVSFSFPAWALGLNVDMPLGGKESSTYLRLNLGYRNALTNIDVAKGGYTFITIGLDLFGRPRYRDF